MTDLRDVGPQAACPQCGELIRGERTCQQAFDEAIALEYADPRYGAVHHLTVLAFMLQHDRYRGDVWLDARTLLERFLREDVTPADARREWTRAGSHSLVLGPPGCTRFPDIDWRRSAADLRLGDPDAYREDVRQWADSVLWDSLGVINPPTDRG